MKSKFIYAAVFVLFMFSFSFSFASDTSCIVSINVGIQNTDAQTNGDVTRLQNFLTSNGYLAEGNMTGYFGPLTLAAVTKFQSANGVDPTGFVGPQSRAKISTIGCGQVLGVFSDLLSAKRSTQNTNTGPLVCTQEAKLCPDGSYVTKDAANNCQFTACPAKQTVNIESPNNGSFAAGSKVTLTMSKTGVYPSTSTYYVYLKKKASQVLGSTVTNQYFALAVKKPLPSGNTVEVTLPSAGQIAADSYFFEFNIADANGNPIASDTSGSVRVTVPTTTTPPPPAATSTITVVSPNGGETFDLKNNNSVFETTWTYQNLVGDVDVYLVFSDESVCYLGKTRVSNKKFTKRFAVGFDCPNSNKVVTIGAGYKVGLLADNNTSADFVAKDESNGNFAITSSAVTPTTPTTPTAASSTITITNPNGGERYKVGDTMLIKWDTKNVPVGSYLSLSLKNGPTPIDIKTDSNAIALTGSNNTFSYVIPETGCQGDMCFGQLEAGNYKLLAAITNMKPTGMIQPPAGFKSLAYDYSNQTFSIATSTQAATSTNYSRIETSLAANRSDYYPGDPITLTYTVKNTGNAPLTYQFSSGCQTDVNGPFDEDYINCSMALTSLVIPANSTKTFTFNKDIEEDADKKTHTLSAQMVGYNTTKATANIRVVATTTALVTFPRNLTLGSTGNDVVALQNILITKGFLVMPAGVAKGYFGVTTMNAVIKMQRAAGISPALGYVGPATRAYLEDQPMAGGVL